jgi:hypothetical protein
MVLLDKEFKTRLRFLVLPFLSVSECITPHYSGRGRRIKHKNRVIHGLHSVERVSSKTSIDLIHKSYRISHGVVHDPQYQLLKENRPDIRPCALDAAGKPGNRAVRGGFRISVKSSAIRSGTAGLCTVWAPVTASPVFDAAYGALPS